MRRTSLRRQHAWVLIGLSLAIAGFGLASSASAQTSFSVESVGGQIGLGNADLRQVVINVIRWVLGILTLTAVVYMMYGGYLWLTAAGSEQRVEKAKQVILQAAIGLVIVLLAWAIVFFVARSVANVTTNRNSNPGGGGSGCNPLVEECGEVTTFDITTIASCAVADPGTDVPRSSAIQLTFNANLQDGTVQQAVADDLTNANPPNLIVQKCANNNCTLPANLSTPIPLENQKYKPGTVATTTGTPQADWTQNGKTITFYHVATDTVAADARLFEPNQKYLLTIPAKTASKALVDANQPSGRTLQNCRRQSSDIAGLPGCDATGDDRITWEFTTGSDVNGPAMNVASTFPSSSYLTTDAIPNRAVARSSFLSIQYSTTIDFNTLSTSNFKVAKCSDTPTAANDWRECDDDTGNDVNPSNFVVEPRPDGRGGILRIVQPAGNAAPFRYEAFAWYRVEVSNVRNLCGRIQEPPRQTWVFQTNNTVPGVKKVYPRDGFQTACPATRVFIQYNTSMWDGSTFDCNVDSVTTPGGSYVTRGLLTNNPGRNLIPTSVFDPNDPNTCSMYEFSSTAILLPPNTNFEGRVESDLIIDSNGRKLNYGASAAGQTSEGPWAFKTATAATCAQEPVITKISPGQGPDGQCLSVIGDYFEKVNYPDSKPNAPDAGDKLELRATSQTPDTWENSYIVSTVNAGALQKNIDQPYTVTVNYPAPIGPLTSAPEQFYLSADNSTQGPCLTKISPTSGLVNTKLTATGKRFGTYVATKSKVLYSTYANPNGWTVNGADWSDTQIGPDAITVNSGSPVGWGDVTVVDSADRESNSLPFKVKSTTTVTPGPGTAPQILETTTCSRTTSPSPNPRRDETQACINAWPSAKFTIPVDPVTMTNGSIRLEQCDASFTTCTAVGGAIIIPFPNNRGFKINPGANLTPSTAYRITVTTGIKSSAGVAMVADYQWHFTTKAGNAECPITQVIIAQDDATFREPFELGLPTEVTDSACNTVDGSGLTYAWSNTNPLICALQPGLTGPANICRSANPIVDEGETLVQVAIPSEGLTSNQVKITVNIVACDTSQQCACGNNVTSQCVGGSCTPVVTAISPSNGRVGTWTTIQGCWLGTYNATTSKVTFSTDKEGLIPLSTSNACTAGNTWSNTQIIREVPKLEEPTNDLTNDAVTGPIIVTRRDGVTANGPVFTVNAEEYPKICRIDPTSLTTPGSATIYGKDLGSDQGAGDKVETTDADTLTVTQFTPYLQWDADRIGAGVPTPGVAANLFGLGSVKVTHLGKVSNPLALTLKNPADTTGGGSGACAPADQCIFGDDSACTDGSGIVGGCGFNNCCAARPTVVTTRPVNGETDVCRNTQVQLDFNQPLLSSSVTASTIRYLDGAQAVNGRIALQNGNRTIAYSPGLLSPGAAQSLKLSPADGQPTLLRGASGVLADVPLAFNLGFTASTAICALDRVTVSPSTKILTATGERFTPDPLAQAFSGRRAAPLAEVPGVYEWNWRWERVGGNDTIATVQNQDDPSTAITAGTAKGKISAKATAKVTVDNNNNTTVNREASGQTEVTVEFCETPWLVNGTPGFTDEAGNCNSGGACPSFHFKLYYCAGANEPQFSHQAIEGQNVDPERKKSLFFKESTTSQDVIGLLIYDNQELLSPFDWFTARFPGTQPGTSTTVGGFPAVKTGTTAYIGVTDLTDANALHGFMMVIDFNSNNASSVTKSIYNRILNSIEFNATQGMSADDRQAIIDDTHRVQDLRSLKTLLTKYKATNGRYPDLPAGSFIPGFSTSSWPSWQREFGNALGRTLPTDPANGFTPGVCQPPYEAASCWSEPAKKFQCPVGSQIYSYKATSGGAGYELFAHLLYSGPGNFSNYSANPCTSFGNGNTCACFNYRLSTP